MTQKTIHFDSASTAAPLTSTDDSVEAARHLGWRILLTLLLLLLVALLSILLQPGRVARAAPLQQSSADPLVLAFYYPWFDENTWGAGNLSDLPAEPYASRDRSVMGRQIDQAKAAGIDAFVVAWYGPGGDTNQTEPNLASLLEEAAARNFKIAILFETDSPFLGGVDSITGALQHALSVHANQPAYLRADGKPVVFFWRSSLYGVGTWGSIRSQVDPNNTSLWIGEGVDAGQLSVFDGHYLYSNTWNPPADLTATNQKFAGRVEAMRQSTGAPKLWVATVMPGYNDVGVRPNSGFARSRDGGAYYTQSWQAAMASNPNWVVITSFNEWPEGTYIEPSQAYGDAYLALTGQYSGQFKAQGSGSIVAAAAPAESVAVVETASVEAAPAVAQAAVASASDVPLAIVQVDFLNLRSGPGIAYGRVGAVVGSDELLIVGQNATGDWWQVKTIAGPAWVSGEFVQVVGPLADVPQVESEQP